MPDYRAVLQLLRAAGCCTVGNGILFVDRRIARIFADKHGGEMVEIREVVPSAWLVKKAGDVVDDDDRLIEVIKKAIADARLEGLVPD